MNDIIVPVAVPGSPPVTVTMPADTAMGDQVNVVRAVDALLKLSPEQRRIVLRAVRKGRGG